MAIVYESVATEGWGTASSITITKPSGLAVGNMMLVHIAADSTNNISPRADWYSLAGVLGAITTTGSQNGRRMGFQYKIADAADVAASNFTWTTPNDSRAGAIIRISGQGSSPAILFGQASVDNGANPSFANGLTPFSTSLLLMLGSTIEGNVGGGSVISNYAIATDNPTWTERYDFGIDAGTSDPHMFGATATRSQITNTGNSSLTIAGGGAGATDSFCYLISINEPSPDANLTPAAIALASAVPALAAFTLSAALSPAAIALAANLPVPVLASNNNPWENTDKAAAPSWQNTNKS
jgi:hypothetical protein